MLSMRALRRFKRYYFHGLRNGLSSEDAADNSMQRTKHEMLELLEADTKLTPIDRAELWGDMLLELVEFQVMLVNIPIDKERLASIKSIADRPDAPPSKREEING